jgi:hypothetical protein
MSACEAVVTMVARCSLFSISVSGITRWSNQHLRPICGLTSRVPKHRASQSILRCSIYRAGGRIMLLLYVAWVATWQAMYDPRLWTEAASSPSKAAPRVNITRS